VEDGVVGHLTCDLNGVDTVGPADEEPEWLEHCADTKH
jgi:hypothetical protein